ncbi:MAG: TIGR03067 domain-containing protein [Planctomycetes bacterium]|nr:TIGR03067 domain-containing protein [Planctomycetota bacterium]
MRALIATTLFVTGLVLAGTAQEPPKQPDKQPDKQPGKKAVDPNEPPVSDPRRLPQIVEGGYTIASGERDGKPIPPAELKDAVVRITGGRVIGTDKDRNELLVAAYTLDTTKTPWAIELKLYGTQGITAPGIVKKEGYVLTMVFARPGGEAPKEFKTKAGQTMFVLRGFVLDPLPPPNKFGSSP